MKVLQFGKFYPVKGGVEKVMDLLREGLTNEGVVTDILCTNFEKGPSMEVFHENGSTTYVTSTLFKKFGTTFSPNFLSTLRRLQSDYDIIHIHHPDPMAGVVLRSSG